MDYYPREAENDVDLPPPVLPKCGLPWQLSRVVIVLHQKTDVPAANGDPPIIKVASRGAYPLISRIRNV